jgi:hypothetical protein
MTNLLANSSAFGLRTLHASNLYRHLVAVYLGKLLVVFHSSARLAIAEIHHLAKEPFPCRGVPN